MFSYFGRNQQNVNSFRHESKLTSLLAIIILTAFTLIMVSDNMI